LTKCFEIFFCVKITIFRTRFSGAPEKFQDFIAMWGTHIVKSVSLGGKFSLKKTARSDSSITVDEFRESVQD